MTLSHFHTSIIISHYIWYVIHVILWAQMAILSFLQPIQIQLCQRVTNWHTCKQHCLLLSCQELSSHNKIEFPGFWIWKSLLNPFSHTTISQQTTFNIFCHKIENLYNWMDNLWPKVENIVTKGEIARFKQFHLLSLCFQNAVCCRESVYMRERVKEFGAKRVK